MPAAQTNADGNSRAWIAGAGEPWRQLTLIDGALLAPMANHAINSISFRRNVESRDYTGGDANLVITMSHAARTPASIHPAFAANHGLDATIVRQGVVTFPASLGTTTTPAWSAPDIAQLTLATPFAYHGGTLALEVSGSPVTAGFWWAADSVRESIPVAIQSVGLGCGPYGSPAGQWSSVAAANLVPGSTVTFTAVGPPGELAAWVLASGTQANAVDLSGFGIPNCRAHVLAPFTSALTFFGPALVATSPIDGGLAQVDLAIPTLPSFLASTFGSQWVHLGVAGIAGSNAHQWSTTQQGASLGMSVVTASAATGLPQRGTTIVGAGHVLRFDYQ